MSNVICSLLNFTPSFDAADTYVSAIKIRLGCRSKRLQH